MEEVIKTSGLRRVFKARKRTVEAVVGVDLNVRAGEIFGFLGPNGAGKTTTLRMLATLLPSLPRAPMQLRLLGQGDWPGIATLAIGLSALQTVLEEGNKNDWFGSNFIVRLSQERRRCGAGASAETRHILAVRESGAGGYRFSADRAPGTVPLEQCGRPVVLGP